MESGLSYEYKVRDVPVSALSLPSGAGRGGGVRNLCLILCWNSKSQFPAWKSLRVLSDFTDNIL